MFIGMERAKITYFANGCRQLFIESSSEVCEYFGYDIVLYLVHDLFS